MDRNSSSMESGLEDIPLDELIRAFIQDREIDVHVALPAMVDSYDRATQTVKVTPQLNRALPDGSGNWIPQTKGITQLLEVPVSFPRCKRFAITFPLARGDTGLVVFCERSIATWRKIGQRTDPGDVGLHTLDGAVFVPGLYADAFPAASAQDSAMVIGSDANGPAQIEITDTEIHAGAGATDGVANGVTLENQLQALQAALDGAFGPASVPLVTPAPGAPDPVYAALRTALAMAGVVGVGSTWGHNIKSLTVKAK